MRLFITSIVLTVTLSAITPAQAHHVDIRPYIAGGKIRIGSAELDGSTVIPLTNDTRVFGSEFGEDDPGQPFLSQDPGFLSESGAFPGGAGNYVGFDVLAGLAYWTGSGFGAVPAGESLQITKGSQSINVSASSVAGFYFGIIASNEDLHEHLSFELLGADGNPNPGDGIEPTPGVWLLEMTLHPNMSGVDSSAPFWIVFNSGGEDFEADHQAAIAWVESNLVPEPASAFLLTIGIALIARRTRNDN